MEHRPLGRTGLHVSRLGLGTLTWGRDTPAEDAQHLLSTFVGAGGSLVDVSDSHGEGAAETVLGGLLGRLVPREEVVLVGRSGTPRGAAALGGRRSVDASRARLLASLDASLARLNTDHLDIWLVAGPDPWTPIEETLFALDAAVRSGRARYVGLANAPGWLLGTATGLQRGRGAEATPAATSVEYSLLCRGVEREVLPAAAHLGLGVLAWAPLGRGVLTGKYRYGTPADSRAAAPHLRGWVEPYLGEESAAVAAAVQRAADGLGWEPLEVALAWVRDAPGVTSTIVGARTAAQLRAATAAESRRLPDPIRVVLDEVSAPDRDYPETEWQS